jgi:hypothetical protein
MNDSDVLPFPEGSLCSGPPTDLHGIKDDSIEAPSVDVSAEMIQDALRVIAGVREKTMSVLKGIAIASLLFSLQLAVAFADDPPKLDVTTTCDAAAKFALAGGRDREGCLADEHDAENAIGQNWSKYNAVDKTQCVGTVKTGGPASYVELLSCLEVMRDAKEFREGNPVQRQDQPAPTPRRRR